MVKQETVKKQFRRQEFTPWEAVVHARQSHNELDKIEGYIPYGLLAGSRLMLDVFMTRVLMVRFGHHQQTLAVAWEQI